MMSAPAARVPVGPLDGGVETQRRPRVGARDDQQSSSERASRRGAASVERRRVNDVLVGQMAAALREHLIFQLDRGDAGVVVLPHGAHDIDRAP